MMQTVSSLLYTYSGSLTAVRGFGVMDIMLVTIQPPYLKYKRLIRLAEIAKETANLRKSTQIAPLSTRA